MKMKNFRKGKAGFTLVECLVAIVVFTIMAMAVALLLNNAVNLHRRNMHESRSMKAQRQALVRAGENSIDPSIVTPPLEFQFEDSSGNPIVDASFNFSTFTANDDAVEDRNGDGIGGLEIHRREVTGMGPPRGGSSPAILASVRVAQGIRDINIYVHGMEDSNPLGFSALTRMNSRADSSEEDFVIYRVNAGGPLISDSTPTVPDDSFAGAFVMTITDPRSPEAIAEAVANGTNEVEIILPAWLLGTDAGSEVLGILHNGGHNIVFYSGGPVSTDNGRIILRGSGSLGGVYHLAVVMNQPINIFPWFNLRLCSGQSDCVCTNCN
jgi:prepilin-type N-terminal cleavage/methylation domain-containing protein